MCATGESQHNLQTCKCLLYISIFLAVPFQLYIERTSYQSLQVCQQTQRNLSLFTLTIRIILVTWFIWSSSYIAFKKRERKKRKTSLPILAVSKNKFSVQSKYYYQKRYFNKVFPGSKKVPKPTQSDTKHSIFCNTSR